MKFSSGLLFLLAGFSLSFSQFGSLDGNSNQKSQDITLGFSTKADKSGFQAGISSLPSDQVPYSSDQSVVDSLYLVGPGDVFQIVYESNAVEKQVTPEGNLSLNRMGIVQLQGLTLRDAKKLILDRLTTSYRKENCYVSLARPKSMKIFITGAVINPGSFEVPGNLRLADALKAAGGFSGLAQKEEVVIVSGKTKRSFRVQKFLKEGDLDSNPYLSQGDIIQVPFMDYSKPWVTLRRGGETFTLQSEPGETLVDLIFKSYGFAPPPPYLAILVREKGKMDSVVLESEARSYVPGPQAYMEVINARSEVFVAGAIAAPGAQPHVSNRRAIQYISAAGLLTSSRVPTRISVIRKNGVRETISIQSAEIEPGDVLFVGQNAEQKFLIYTPILLSVVSLALVYLQVTK